MALRLLLYFKVITKKNEGGQDGEQTILDPQNKTMVKHSNRLSDKKRKTKVKGKGNGSPSVLKKKYIKFSL